MPRSNWKGVISFGLVTIPIVLYPTDDKSEKVSFHQIDKRDLSRIKYKHVNENTGKEVDWKNIIKGYEYAKGKILPVEEDEINYVAGESARTIEIDKFVDSDSIHFIDIERTYYLAPDKMGDKGYVILREALLKSGKIAIARVLISTKEYVAAIGCYENTLLIYLLRYHHEIRSLKGINIPSSDLKAVKASKKEIEIARQLITSMSSKWKPDEYKDEYAKVVKKWVAQKIKHKNIPKPKKAVTKSKNNVVDFVELLKQSLKHKKTPVRSKKAYA